MKQGKTIRAVRVGSKGRREEITATISPGRRTGCEDIGICDVDCPALFSQVHQIAGIDDAQALELGEAFLKEMLEHYGYQPV